jgi:hypothetical protein
MASSKNVLQPRLMALEGREQPGSLLTTGLDASFLAGAFLGDALVNARPAQVATHLPAKKTEALDLAIQLPTELQIVQNSTVKLAEATSMEDVAGLGIPTAKPAATISEYLNERPGMARPGSNSGSRGPNLLNYNGDFDTRNGLANEFNTIVTDARTYDGFRIRGSATKDCFFSHNLMNFTGVTTANVHVIGPGFVTGGVSNGGLATVFSGTALPATQVATGLSGFGFTEYEIKVCGLGLTFGPGHYYVNVQPIGVAGVGRSFNSTANGLDNPAGGGAGGTVDGASKGGPGANDDSWFDSPYYSAVFADSELYLGTGPFDFSTGVCMAPSC